MNTEHIKRLETLTGRKLSGDEVARLGRIQSVLNLTDNDALWDVLAALEYQRAYYDALPVKITAATKELLQDIAVAAKTEAQRAQDLLAKSVAAQARELSLRANIETLAPLGLVALVCLLGFGSLLMWAGYCFGSKKIHDMHVILHMPSGYLISGLCLAGGVFMLAYALRKDNVVEGWWKMGLIGFVMVIVGGVIVGLAM